jgi:hypothetical protein
LLIFVFAFLYATCAEISKAQAYEGKVIKVTGDDFIYIFYEGMNLRLKK